MTNAALDDYADGLPETGTLVVVTSTYNGGAPDSATKMETAIREKRIGEVERPELTYAVLGVGNTQWKTYQAFPKLVESTLRQTGAKNLLRARRGRWQRRFRRGRRSAGWARCGRRWARATHRPQRHRASRSPSATRTRRAPACCPKSAYRLEVIGNDELVGDATGLWDFSKEAPRSSTRHMTIRLPKDVTYRAGDHLAVYARNRPEVVDSIIERLGLRPDQVVVLDGKGSRMRHLPIGKPVTVRQLLSDFVELQDAATRSDVRALLDHTRCPVTTKELTKLVAEDDEAKKAFARDITDKRITVYDLLMRYPAIELTLEGLLEMTSAIRPRFYSISSSPLALPDAINLTVGTVAAPAWSGSGFYQGVASSHLRSVKPGEEILGFVRRPNPPFAPPEDPGAAADPGGTRHGLCSAQGLHAGAGRAARQGDRDIHRAAVLRLPASRPRLVLPRRDAGLGGDGRRQGALRLSPAPTNPRTGSCRTRSGPPASRCGRRSRAAAWCSCAATGASWRRPCARR